MGERRVIVTGATGLLGRQVLKVLTYKDWQVKGTGFSRADGGHTINVDLREIQQVNELLDKIQPHVIIHCAAERFPDRVEKDPEGARALNVSASKSLARSAADRDILLIYISTDYVFPGQPGEAPYETSAQPRATNLYGQTKLDGEQSVLDEYEKAGKAGSGVVLRVPVLYGSAENPSESAVNVLLDAVWKVQSEDEKVKMDHWALRYPTNTEDVGRVCHDIAVKYLDATDRAALPKILHFSSEDKMTKYEICKTFGRIMGLAITSIEPQTQGNDPGASVQRPFDCHLSTAALRELGIDVSTCDFDGWWRRELGAFRK